MPDNVKEGSRMKNHTKTSIASCIGCGCTDDMACCDEDNGEACYWLRVDRESGHGVCSTCSALVPGWDAGERQKRLPASLVSRVALNE